MTAVLKIENDADLRAYMKECIKGQVLAIVREEYIEIVKAEIQRKISALGTRDFDQLLRSAFTAAAKEIISKKTNITDWNNDFVNPMLSKVLTARIDTAIERKDWDKLVDTLAKEKVKSLIS